MQQPRSVRMTERIQDRHRNLERASDVQSAEIPEIRTNRMPVDEGHHIVGEPLSLADEVDRQNVGMIETGDDAGLVPKPGQHTRGPGNVRSQHLDREAPGQPAIVDLIDLGEATATDQSPDLVAVAQNHRELMTEIGGTHLTPTGGRGPAESGAAPGTERGLFRQLRLATRTGCLRHALS